MKKLLLSCLCVLGIGVAGATEISDLITAEGLGVTKTNSYANLENAKFRSDAVYASNCTMNNSGSIQIRSNNSNSGIVSTTSGGYVTKVEVNWDAATTSGRVLNVYASNTPYTAATDLYDASKAGTLVGTITYTEGEPTSVSIDADYKYVGIRSKSGAIYLVDVTVTWNSEETGNTPDDPVVDPEEPTVEEVADIAAWLAKADTANDVKITGNVTVIYQNGKNLYVKDNSGYLLVFFSQAPTTSYTNGNVLSGITGKYVDYNGLPEMTPDASTFGDAIEGDAVEPTLVMIGDVNAEPLSSYIELQGITIGEASGRTVPASDVNGDEINLYNSFNLAVPEAGENYTVRGFVSVYKGTYQINYTEVLNPQEAVTVATPTFSVPACPVPQGTPIAIECTTPGADIYYSINEGEYVIYTEPIVIEVETNISAYATKDGMTDSEVATAYYSIMLPPSENVVYTMFRAPAYSTTTEAVVLTNNDDSEMGANSSEDTSICGTSFETNAVSIQIDKGSNNSWSFVANDQVRWYKGATMTITPAEGRRIVGVEFAYATGYGNGVKGYVGDNEWGFCNIDTESKQISWVGETESTLTLVTNDQIRFYYVNVLTDGDPLTEETTGDLNGDNQVDAADIAFLINMLLGDTETTPAADVNGDGEYDAADIAVLIQILLGEN